MLNALKTDLVHVDFSFTRCEVEDEQPRPLERLGGKFYGTPNTIINLRVRATNTSRSSNIPIFI